MLGAIKTKNDKHVDKGKDRSKEKLKKKEILANLNEALDVIERIPPEKRTDREEWILNTIRESLGKMDEKGRILVGGEEGFGSGKKKFIKYEGVPVDALMDYLKEQVDPSFLENLCKRAEYYGWREDLKDVSSDSEKIKKGIWYSVFRSLDTKGSGLAVDLVNEAEERVKSWEIADKRTYKGTEKTDQLGEALYQIVKERLEKRRSLKEDEVSRLENLVKFLEENSKPFQSNSDEERDERIKLEGYYIYKEGDYRGKADPNGDYYNGEADLKRRRELDFGSEEEKEKVFYRKTNIVAVDEIVKRMARRQADERIAELLHDPEEGMASSSRLKSILNNLVAPFRHPVRFGQKVWVRMAEEGYRYKFYREALEQITQNQNLMIELERNYRIGRESRVLDPNERKENHFMLLDKVIDEYSNNAVEMEELGVGVKDHRLDVEMKKFFYSCLLASKAKRDEGGLQRDLFERMQRGFLRKMKKRGIIMNEDFLGEGNIRSGLRSVNEIEGGRMYASNLFRIFQDYESHIKNSMEKIGIESDKRGEKLTREQKEQLENHINSTLALDVELGAKLADILNRRPEGSLNYMDRAIGALQSLPILRRIASTPGAAAILGAISGNLGSKSLLRWGLVGAGVTTGIVTGAWLPVLTGAISAGTFGALRRNKELKNDRAMHQRQRAEGREYSERFRRGKIENFQYNVRSTSELNTELDEIIEATNNNGGRYDLLSPEQKGLLAEIFARYKVELARDRERRLGTSNATVDLITAASPQEGQENNTNYLSKTDLKIKLYRYLEQQNLINQEKMPIEGEFNDLFRQRACALVGNIEDADRAFDDYRRRSAAVTGLMAGLSGAAGVFAGQALIDKFFFSGGRYTAWDSLKDLFKGTGTKEISDFLPAISLNGQRLQPGLQEITFQGEKFEIFVNPKDGITIDPLKSKLPEGWKFENSPDGGLNLVHEVIDQNPKIVPAKDWDEFVQKNGWKNDQRVSYHKFNYQLTAPDKGVKALPETTNNFLNNLRLKANSTELMMQFKPDKSGNGDVLVDVSKMFSKIVRAGGGDKGLIPEEIVKKGGKFFLALSESNNETQYNPILIPMDENGIIRVPKDLARIFFSFDEKGNLIAKEPGRGMKSFIFDTGLRREKDGAMIVEGIASRLGEKPELNIFEKTRKWEIFPFGIDTGKELDIPWAVGSAVSSRWQLEEEKGKNKKKRDYIGKTVGSNNVFDKDKEDPLAKKYRPFIFRKEEDDDEESKNGNTQKSTPDNKKWMVFKKNFPSWKIIDEYLKELAILGDPNKGKKERLEEAKIFLLPFAGFSGVLQPSDKRQQFDKFVQFFRVKTKNNLISKRELAKFFIRLIEEEIKNMP